MSGALVSVLIPVYNRGELVCRAIESALQQTYSNIEIIIVDNASTDNTWKVINSYAEQDQRIQCYQNEHNIGPIRNWYECLRHSKGEYIKILFSDDWLVLGAIEEFVKPLATNPKIGFSYSPAILHDGASGAVTYQKKKSITGVFSSDMFLVGTISGEPLPVSPSCALFRRADVDIALRQTWDDEMGLSCYEKGFGNDLLVFLFACASYPYGYYVSEPNVYFGVHGLNITKTGFDNNIGKVRLCYRSAFAHFLRSATLEKKQKTWLRTILLLSVVFSKKYIEMDRIQQYKRLVKDKESLWDINLFDKRILPLISQRIALSHSRRNYG